MLLHFLSCPLCRIMEVQSKTEGGVLIKKSVLNCVETKLDDVDDFRDNDWYMLGDKLMSEILNRPEFTGEITEKQKQIIVEACRETYRAASIIAKAYAYSAVEEFFNASAR